MLKRHNKYNKNTKQIQPTKKNTLIIQKNYKTNTHNTTKEITNIDHFVSTTFCLNIIRLRFGIFWPKRN